MSSNLEIVSTNQSFAVRQERRRLLRAFWIAVTVFFLLELYTIKVTSLVILASAVSITVAALFPLYLWCSGKALGMPIFPLFALTYLWTYALPLVSDSKEILSYSSADIFLASLTTIGFLGLGTFVWFQFVNSTPAIPKYYRVLKVRNSEEFFLIILFAGILFNMSLVGGWFKIDGGAFSLIRGTILGLNALSIFILSYRCGTKELSKIKSYLFLALLALYIIANTASLLLVGALSTVLLVAVAFIVGRRQVPWLPIIVVLICLAFLHYGKAEMRTKYWQPDQPQHLVQPWQYLAWYEEWLGYSVDYFNVPASQKVERQSFSNRASVIHLLLLAQTQTPKYVPHLSGLTYKIIPQLLIPRILNKDKFRTHLGTYILNIRYGLQNWRATSTTTIGWGLLNEAYVNFGFSGCAGFAVISGLAYGQATRWSINSPLLSSRSLFGVLLISFAFQTEWTAGVYVSALFQSLVPLSVITFVFMKVHSNE